MARLGENLATLEGETGRQRKGENCQNQEEEEEEEDQATLPRCSSSTLIITLKCHSAPPTQEEEEGRKKNPSLSYLFFFQAKKWGLCSVARALREEQHLIWCSITRFATTCCHTGEVREGTKKFLWTFFFIINFFFKWSELKPLHPVEN